MNPFAFEVSDLQKKARAIRRRFIQLNTGALGHGLPVAVGIALAVLWRCCSDNQ